MINRLIHIECNPDEVLMLKYGFTKRRIIHSSGKARIAKLLEKNRGHIALVDEDPNGTLIPYFKNTNFFLLKQENGYIIKKDLKREYIIIELQPNLEEWIIDACKEASINIKNYKLPNNAISLHHIINNNLKKFEKLLLELLKHNCRIKWLKDDLKKFSTSL
ncbi:MAG: hypothetical protein ACP6IY_17725 [Promethearchaeia archaeon]